MIIIKTKMKRIPDTCTKCPYSLVNHDCCDYEGDRYCVTNGYSIPMEYVKEKRNWCYIKPDWCPLEEIDK